MKTHIDDLCAEIESLSLTQKEHKARITQLEQFVTLATTEIETLRSRLDKLEVYSPIPSTIGTLPKKGDIWYLKDSNVPNEVKNVFKEGKVPHVTYRVNGHDVTIPVEQFTKVYRRKP